MDLALILEHLEQYQLASAYDVRSVWMWTEEGGLVFEATLESKRARRFGSDRVRWHRPVESTLSGSPQEYGFDDWESFIAEDVMSEFFDGFEGGGFWVFGRDPDGVVRVGDPWDPDHLSEPDDGVSAQGVRVRRAVEYRRPSILRTLWAVAGGGPCDEGSSGTSSSSATRGARGSPSVGLRIVRPPSEPGLGSWSTSQVFPAT